MISARKNPSLNQLTLRESAMEEHEAIPFSPIKLMQENPYGLRVNKDSIFEDARSDLMNDKINSRSQSMMNLRQSQQSYKLNLKNMQMWQKIMNDVLSDF
jgi:6-phosphogluconate dehydrogenase